ncbi:MAG: NfeD family protein [Haliscomenobacter sp.]|nr:NfeD family protein [Haliscomenobacter sp.]MBK8879522.1 NfeD family protein [Haliscomenobacter sp.]
MPKWFFIEAVVLNGWIVQLFWLIAIVASLLLFLLFLLNWFGINQDRHLYSAGQRAFGDPLAVLIFFTFLGWTSILSSLWVKRPEFVLFYAIPASAVAACFPWFLSYLRRKERQKKGYNPEYLLKSTGEVLQNIPPHQIGKGRVHLSLRATPHDWEAVTSCGGELPAGVHIRVVEVIDDHTVLVEPLDLPPSGPPKSPPGNAGGSIS